MVQRKQSSCSYIGNLSVNSWDTNIHDNSLPSHDVDQNIFEMRLKFMYRYNHLFDILISRSKSWQ